MTHRTGLSDSCTDRFNPHTHEGCDVSCKNRIALMLRFQSTHPRRVWLWISLYFCKAVAVSIHTPTKGVTVYALQQRDIGMFQSTHPRRVWHFFPFIAIYIKSFNPHTHEGCDLEGLYVPISQFRVSIHTPTKGVTKCLNEHVANEEFQSTHPRRVWQTADDYTEDNYEFQSTHPRRVWLQRRSMWI